MNEPDQFPEEDIDDWFRHPGTIAKVKFWMTQKEQARLALNATCSESTDPKVRAAYARYEEMVKIVATLTPQPKKEPNGKR